MLGNKHLTIRNCFGVSLLTMCVVQFAPAEDRLKIAKLLSADQFDRRTPLLLHPQPHQNRVYLVVLADSGGDGATARLVSISLAGGGFKQLGQISLNRNIAAFGIPFGIRSIVTASCVDRDSYYAAIKGAGIVEFDLRRDRASALVKSSNLPDDGISSMVLVGGNLFVGCQGKLLRVSVMANSAEPVFDTANIDTPYPKGRSIVISHQLYDATRNRLLFFAQARLDRRIEHGSEVDLWQYNLKTKSAKRLARLGRLQSGLTADLDGEVLTLSDTWIATWNLANGKRTIVANYSLGDWQFTRKLWIPRMHHAVICRDAVWWVAAADKVGTFTYPDGNPKEQDLNDFSMEVHGNTVGHFTRRIDDNRFLIYNAGRVLLATLSNGKRDDRSESQNSNAKNAE